MTLRIYDRVQETTTSTGTGALTLAGAVTKMRSFAGAGGVNGDAFWALIEHASAAEWEITLCTYSAGAITRATTPAASSNGTPGAYSKVDFSAGTKTVSLIAPAFWMAWQTKTAGYTAVSGDRLDCNTVSSAFTVTLPASPSAGDRIEFNDLTNSWPTNKLTIDGNGHPVETGDRLICDVSCKFALAYSGTTWRVR